MKNGYGLESLKQCRTLMWGGNTVPTAYSLKFAFRKSLLRLHNSLGCCESIHGHLPRGHFYLPTPAAFFTVYTNHKVTILYKRGLQVSLPCLSVKLNDMVHLLTQLYDILIYPLTCYSL